MSPLNDEDRWAVVASLAARYGGNDVYPRILQAVRVAELELWPPERNHKDEYLSRVDWRVELAERARGYI